MVLGIRFFVTTGLLALQSSFSAAATKLPEVRWQHPAGLITTQTLTEATGKLSTQDWARRLYESRKATLQTLVSCTIAIGIFSLCAG